MGIAPKPQRTARATRAPNICTDLHTAPSRRGSYPPSRTTSELGASPPCALLLCAVGNERSRNHSADKKPPTLHKLQLPLLFRPNSRPLPRLTPVALPQHTREKLPNAPLLPKPSKSPGSHPASSPLSNACLTSSYLRPET